jgi:adenine-specific DNA methylase
MTYKKKLIEVALPLEAINKEAARENYIYKGKPPPVYDPFCGGGSIPLEAQRMGLEAHASDLNPVPVLINKALIEIPPKFASKPPVNPEAKKKLGASGSWKGAAGLAEDIRYYGQWMRDEAEKRIGHLYPKVKLPKEHGGGEARVIAWLWARTVASPNPAAKGGTSMSVRTALSLINQSLDEVLAEQEGEFDADTRWALAWFDQNGFNEGAYGMAETLCTAKNTSVQGVKDAGILEAKGGKVRLLKKEELDADWNPATDSRLTIWEITHHLIRRLEQGESGAAELIQQLGAKTEVARDLSYRLYTICERRKWAQEAIDYNALVLSWSDVQRLAQEKKAAAPTQGEMQL